MVRYIKNLDLFINIFLYIEILILNISFALMISFFSLYMNIHIDIICFFLYRIKGRALTYTRNTQTTKLSILIHFMFFNQLCSFILIL